MTQSGKRADQHAGTPAFQETAFAQVDARIEQLIGELAGRAPLLERMARYHLGLCTADGKPTSASLRQRVQGKRVRPAIAMLACAAIGGSTEAVVSLAAAIELVHNFTVIHDDIQDRSPNRRHRPTVWNVWGEAQAINAGDALFAAAQIGVLDGADQMLDAGRLVEVGRAFNRMTIDIVRGQVLDLGFEGLSDVTPDDYMDMIRGKTAAIVEFSAWAGAALGGGSADVAQTFAGYGRSLGIGFQIRDDALGVWGASEETGKDTGDDIRRRKQSLPVLLLRAVVQGRDRETLDRIYGGDTIDDRDVDVVLSMFERHGIRDKVEAQVRLHHDDAEIALRALEDTCQPEPLHALRQLTDRLAMRVA